jgi:hypothetical protein
MRLFRAFRLETVILLLECPFLAHPRCGEFLGLVEPSHRMKAKRHNMFWKVAGSPDCLVLGPGLNKRL